MHELQNIIELSNIQSIGRNEGEETKVNGTDQIDQRKYQLKQTVLIVVANILNCSEKDIICILR